MKRRAEDNFGPGKAGKRSGAWLKRGNGVDCRAVGSCEGLPKPGTVWDKGLGGFSPEAGFWGKQAGK